MQTFMEHSCYLLLLVGPGVVHVHNSKATVFEMGREGCM